MDNFIKVVVLWFALQLIEEFGHIREFFYFHYFVVAEFGIEGEDEPNESDCGIPRPLRGLEEYCIVDDIARSL